VKLSSYRGMGFERRIVVFYPEGGEKEGVPHLQTFFPIKDGKNEYSFYLKDPTSALRKESGELGRPGRKTSARKYCGYTSGSGGSCTPP